MGLRLRKKLGYGLTDLKVNGGQIIDDRINVNSPLLDTDILDELYSSSEDALANYTVFINKHNDTADFEEIGVDMYAIKDKKNDIPSLLHEIVTFAPEGGLDNVLLVTPISGLGYRWYRNDDIMDYIENSYREEPLDPEIRQLSEGIHPFNTYMDTVTGKRLPHWVAEEWVRAKKYTEELSLQEDVFSIEELARKLGYTSHAEASDRVVPEVPADVRNICRWGSLFNNPQTVLELRPLYYTYWT